MKTGQRASLYNRPSTNRFFMLAQRSVYHSNIEVYLRCVCILLEYLKRFLIILLVVEVQSFYPAFNFLYLAEVLAQRKLARGPI